MHVMNTVRPLSPKVPDQKVPLTPLSHGVTCEDFGVVTHVPGGEGLFCKVGNPITELIVTCRDEAALFAVQGVADKEVKPTAITMGRQVRWIDDIIQED